MDPTAHFRQSNAFQSWMTSVLGGGGGAGKGGDDSVKSKASVASTDAGGNELQDELHSESMERVVKDRRRPYPNRQAFPGLARA